ncbi:hypothetical protein [Aestuariivirga sp.]|uniref:hypothetical protein n=1 Tax=Aestuariivirga sp. TaxID=2650926 RepID=UPI003593B2B6
MTEKIGECKHGANAANLPPRAVCHGPAQPRRKNAQKYSTFCASAGVCFLADQSMMSHHTSMRVKLTIRMVLLRLRRILAVCLTLLLFASLFLPGFNAVSLSSTAQAESMAEDCPFHQGGGQQPERPGLHDCGCILCFAPGTPSTSFEPDVYVPAPLLRDAGLSFATGVSATHGRRETTNLSTGPPML